MTTATTLRPSEPTPNRFADLAARMRARDEARFPRLKEIKTHPVLDIIPMMTEDEFARLV